MRYYLWLCKSPICDPHHVYKVPTREGELYLCAEVDELRWYWNQRANGGAQYMEFIAQRKQLTRVNKEVCFEVHYPQCSMNGLFRGMQELCRVWAKQRLNNRRAELDDMRQQRLLA